MVIRKKKITDFNLLDSAKLLQYEILSRNYFLELACNLILLS